jgi:arginyl-tRNA synthetase
MNILHLLRSRFEPALASLVANPRELLEMIRPAQDAKFGDYQANFAMKLGKEMGQPPREVAQMVAAKTDLADLCETVEVAGPGFINLKLKDSWLLSHITASAKNERLGVAPVAEPKTYVVDYSSPNVAKPMHVGHIRSTVIGDALYRTLKFLGHKVISDNHLGDWGTQFGMIIYGYKHFLDKAAYERAPVVELGRLYKKVHKLVDYQETKAGLAKLEAASAEKQKLLKTLQDQTVPADKNEQKKHAKNIEKVAKQAAEAETAWLSAQAKIVEVEHDAEYGRLVGQHATIAEDVLKETAKLHEGDPVNVALWHEFLPACREAIYTIYNRLDIRFDYELGESFYHPMLAEVVQDFIDRGLARESEGAMCVFLAGQDAPMIIRKRDGAFLYSTTDLATIEYRMEHWKPDVVLYVVDHRQGEHFDKLFAAARLWGYDRVELRHISFGTILGEDGKPYKTRSGDTVGLESLLDEAVSRALEVVQANDREHEVAAEQQQSVAEIVGIGALKYADLMQNRTSDYKFSYDKMLATNGNTATYMQYSYARVQSIFRKAEIDVARLRETGEIIIEDATVRAVVLDLLRFDEALSDVLIDYQPNLLTNYLFELTGKFFVFYESHSIKNAETQLLRESRALICDLVGRTIKTGLELLGIKVVERM